MGLEPPNCVLLCLGVYHSVMLETLEFQRLTLQSVEIVGVAETLFSDSFGAKMVHAKRGRLWGTFAVPLPSGLYSIYN